jgi:hypothetical protein
MWARGAAPLLLLAGAMAGCGAAANSDASARGSSQAETDCTPAMVQATGVVISPGGGFVTHRSVPSRPQGPSENIARRSAGEDMRS